MPPQGGGSDDGGWPGHAVLQLPVPPLEPAVRARYQRYDQTLLSARPGFIHAHVTALGPVPGRPSCGQAAALARVCREWRPGELMLDRVAVFPDGIIHVLLADPSPVVALTDALCAIFPDHRPYGGTQRTEPHVTVDAVGPGVTEASVGAELGPLLPCAWRPASLDLAWYRPHEVRALRSWPVGDAR